MILPELSLTSANDHICKPTYQTQRPTATARHQTGFKIEDANSCLNTDLIQLNTNLRKRMLRFLYNKIEYLWVN